MNLTFIATYEPTMSSSEEYQDKFYEELNEVVETTSKSYKLSILGEFNARVGTNYETWNGVLRKHGIGKQTTTAYGFCNCAPSTKSPSQTHCFVCQIIRKRPGCIRDLNTGISSTMC